MLYSLTGEFTQIAETTGTIQNSSHVGTIEMSTSDTPDSGILIYPLQKVSFSDQTIYLRCIDGYAEARVLPFELVTEGGDMQVLKRVFADISYSGSNLAFLSPTGEVLKYFNLPEEIYLRSIGTTFVPNFTWSVLTYPNSINPNLNGKPVLVLHIKGDSLDSPYEDWGFCNLEDLIDLYVPADPSIAISDNSIKAAISSDTNNLLTLKNNGLFVISDTTKVDKVDNATAGNIVELDTAGNIVDSGYSALTILKTKVITMYDDIWTAVGNPILQNDILTLDGSSYLIANDLTLGGRDFTVCGWAKLEPSALGWTGAFAIGATPETIWFLRLTRYRQENDRFEVRYSRRYYQPYFTPGLTTRFHFEMDYQHSTGKLFVFFNGTLYSELTHTYGRSTLHTNFIGASGDYSSDVWHGLWKGTIEKFCILDGMALHTKNFTPN